MFMNKSHDAKGGDHKVTGSFRANSFIILKKIPAVTRAVTFAVN